jgi:hypothetical protein
MKYAMFNLCGVHVKYAHYNFFDIIKEALQSLLLI